MSEQCKGTWHDYPNCEDCPVLGDSCDGSDEWNEEQDAMGEAFPELDKQAKAFAGLNIKEKI